VALKDLTREAILRAVEEYDRLTAAIFLAKHGFSRAKRYWLQHDGRLYPSKAIAGVAHGYLPGRSAILASATFTGGEASVVRVFRNLGFAVVDGVERHVVQPPWVRADGADTSLPSGRVWITSFWGFNPEGEGYFGFTREGDRNFFLQHWRSGDLVMVYGTLGDSTEPDDRGRVLGFLEVEPNTIRDIDRMSPEGRRWKVENRVTNRWTYAVPVIRAWRAVDRPAARALAPSSLGPGASFQLIASRGIFLAPDEAEAALAIRVRPVQVYGQAPLDDDEKKRVYVPSRGFPMSFGKRSFETQDGIHFLYALQLEGDVAAMVGEASHLVRGKIVVKVGLAKNPDERCRQHNDCLPPALKMRWKLLLRSAPLSDGNAAFAAEKALKDRFDRVYRSLGGEFFLCEEKTLAAELATAHRRAIVRPQS